MSIRSGRLSGITLLELLIVVVIVGILATIAYPSYRDFATRAKRTEARVQLLEIAANQERFYLNANRYGTLAELGYSEPLLTDSGVYTVTIAVNNSSDFIAVARYNRAGNELERCASFSLDGRGNKSSTGSFENCWTDQP